MATKNEKAGKGKLVTIRFDRTNKSKIKNSHNRTRTGALSCNNRRKAHGNIHKH